MRMASGSSRTAYGVRRWGSSFRDWRRVTMSRALSQTRPPGRKEPVPISTGGAAFLGTANLGTRVVVGHAEVVWARWSSEDFEVRHGVEVIWRQQGGARMVDAVFAVLINKRSPVKKGRSGVSLFLYLVLDLDACLV